MIGRGRRLAACLGLAALVLAACGKKGPPVAPEMRAPLPIADLTVTFGALKPAHLLYPAMHRCGRVVLADIGIEPRTEWHEIAAPRLPPVEAGMHKYTRGLVHALAGKMPGAIALAAAAAVRTGAGYVRVSTSRHIEGLPAAIVQTDSGARQLRQTQA